jgi:hypothetical protein
MALPSMAELEGHPFTQAADAFLRLLANDDLRQHPAEELMQRAADLIRAADDVLAWLAAGDAHDSREARLLGFLVRDLRAMAFTVMQRVNPGEAWFWTENWQAGEREVDANIAAGRTTHYTSDEEFLAALDAIRENPDAYADIRD